MFDALAFLVLPGLLFDPERRGRVGRALATSARGWVESLTVVVAIRAVAYAAGSLVEPAAHAAGGQGNPLVGIGGVALTLVLVLAWFATLTWILTARVAAFRLVQGHAGEQFGTVSADILHRGHLA